MCLKCEHLVGTLIMLPLLIILTKLGDITSPPPTAEDTGTGKKRQVARSAMTPRPGGLTQGPWLYSHRHEPTPELTCAPVLWLAMKGFSTITEDSQQQHMSWKKKPGLPTLNLPSNFKIQLILLLKLLSGFLCES